MGHDWTSTQLAERSQAEGWMIHKRNVCHCPSAHIEYLHIGPNRLYSINLKVSQAARKHCPMDQESTGTINARHFPPSQGHVTQL